MKQFWTIALIVALAVLLLFWRLNQSPPAPKAAALLPDTTVLLLEFPDFARTRANFPKTAAYALWQEPQVQSLAQDVNRTIMESLGAPKGKGQRRSFVPSLFDPAKGEVFFAVTDLSLEPRFGFNVVLGLDVQRDLLVTKLALSYHEFRIRTWNRSARFYTKKHCGVPYRVCELNPQLRICHTFLNSLLVYTLSEDTLCEVIARFAVQTRGNFVPLGASPKYQETVAQLRPAPEFVAYVNPASFRNAWPASLWLSRAGPVALGTTFLDTQLRDMHYSRHVVAMAASPALVRFQTIVLTAPQTAFYRVGITDWESAYRETADALAASGNRDLFSKLIQFERSLRRNSIRPDEDLFRLLGPETALLANWREGARLPDAALVVELQNPDSMRLRLDVAMTALKDALSATNSATPWDITPFHDETLRTLRFRTSAFAPTYFTADKFFVLASSPDYARELVGQLKELVPTLAMNADYQEAMKHLPTNVSAYAYCNLCAVTPPLLAGARAGLVAAPNPFIRTDKLPASETLTRHLVPLVSATLADSRGETVITISPLGEPATMMLGALAGYFAVRPYLPASPAAPTTSSSTATPPPPSGNRTAPLQTPTR